MRILKPNKSSTTGPQEPSSGLSFTMEEINLDQKDVCLDWLNRTDAMQSIAAAGNSMSDRSIGKPKTDYNRLLSKGIKLLSMREHSVQEITTKLAVKCETMDVVYAVVNALIQSKYLSDSRFTESYVRSRQNRGFGPSKIRNELSSKGIKANMIEDYLDVTSSVWYENARNQYQKKYGDKPVKDYNTWAKRARFMQSRGFSMEHIHVTLPPVDHD